MLSGQSGRDNASFEVPSSQLSDKNQPEVMDLENKATQNTRIYRDWEWRQAIQSKHCHWKLMIRQVMGGEKKTTEFSPGVMQKIRNRFPEIVDTDKHITKQYF